MAAGAGAAVAYLALFKTLYLLRWLGVFGLLATAANRITSYNSANVRPHPRLAPFFLNSNHLCLCPNGEATDPCTAGSLAVVLAGPTEVILATSLALRGFRLPR